MYGFSEGERVVLLSSGFRTSILKVNDSGRTNKRYLVHIDSEGNQRWVRESNLKYDVDYILQKIHERMGQNIGKGEEA